MTLPFTADELAAAVAVGDVTARRHPSMPYTIYNYSPSVQYENKWNDITENCRGLILDDDFNIVARPWRKFYNLGQVDLPIQFDTPVEIMDKADGSLGILYEGDYGNHIATRGSFESTQAIAATEIWETKYQPQIVPMRGYTLLFEIILPENRIVLDYGDQRDLILLGAVENDTGYYIGPLSAKGLFMQRTPFGFDYGMWQGPVVEVMPFNTLSDALANTDRKNAEGFVIRSHNFMVKIKQPDYLILHRLVTNASPLTVWEQLRDGKSKSEIVSAFPDEWHSYIGGMVDELTIQFDTRLDQILSGFSKIPGGLERKEFAMHVSKDPNKKYYFSLLDKKPIKESLWSEVRPRANALSSNA